MQRLALGSKKIIMIIDLIYIKNTLIHHILLYKGL
jgi:hypothetical protein